jgi:hypothetical protein
MRYETDNAFWLLGLADQGRRILLSAICRMDDPLLPEIQKNFPAVSPEHVELTLNKLQEYGWIGNLDGMYYPKLEGAVERLHKICMQHFGESYGKAPAVNDNLCSRQALMFNHYGLYGTLKAVRENDDPRTYTNMHEGQVKALLLSMQKADVVRSSGRNGSSKTQWKLVSPPVAQLGLYLESLVHTTPKVPVDYAS